MPGRVAGPTCAPSGNAPGQWSPSHSVGIGPTKANALISDSSSPVLVYCSLVLLAASWRSTSDSRSLPFNTLFTYPSVGSHHVRRVDHGTADRGADVRRRQDRVGAAAADGARDRRAGESVVIRRRPCEVQVFRTGRALS